MTIIEWLELLSVQVKATSAIEWTAVIFGVLQVLLAKKNKVLLYPAGIIATIASAYVLFNYKLYAESALNIYYLVMSIYGWIYWTSSKNKTELPITNTRKNEWIIVACIVLVGWAVLYLILKHLTPSDVPILDSLVSSTAWAGMWLLARRKLENWIMLNVSNAIAVPLLIHKELPLFAALTIFLFIIAILGYYDWKRMATIELSNDDL